MLTGHTATPSTNLQSLWNKKFQQSINKKEEDLKMNISSSSGDQSHRKAGSCMIPHPILLIFFTEISEEANLYRSLST